MFMLCLGVSAEKKAGNKPLEHVSRAEVERLDDHIIPLKSWLTEFWGHLMGSAKLLLHLTCGASVSVPTLTLL